MSSYHRHSYVDRFNWGTKSAKKLGVKKPNRDHQKDDDENSEERKDSSLKGSI
jgi:hypothetical protein